MRLAQYEGKGENKFIVVAELEKEVRGGTTVRGIGILRLRLGTRDEDTWNGPGTDLNVFNRRAVAKRPRDGYLARGECIGSNVDGAAHPRVGNDQGRNGNYRCDAVSEIALRHEWI